MRIKKEEGITLIALVITVVILIIIVGISLSVLLTKDGLINKSIDAKEQYVISEITDKLNIYGLEKQTENQGKVEINEYLDYISTKNEYTIEVEDNDENTDFAKYLLIDSKYEFLVEEKGDGEYIHIEYLGKIGERDGLVLSEYEGEIVYPNSGEFRIKKNASKGELSVTASNPDAVSVTLDEKRVIIEPKVLLNNQEEVIITVVSKGKGTQPDLTAEYRAIVNQGRIEVLSTGYNGIYDGLEHGINVEVNPAEAVVLYSVDGINYDLDESPKYRDVGRYEIFYKVSLEGYTTISGSKTVELGKTHVSISLSETSGTIIYPNETAFTVNADYAAAILSVESLDTSVATATINGNIVTITPSAVNSTKTTTIRVTAEESTNSFTAYKDYSITVEQGDLVVNVQEYYGHYDGSEHGIIVTVIPEEATILYSEDGVNYDLSEAPKYTDVVTRTTFFKAMLDGYKTVSSSSTVTINKIKDEQAPVAASIQISGNTYVSSLPTTLSATVTHEDIEGTATTESSGIDISKCKYTLNTSSIELGTNPSSYDSSFSSNGQTLTLTLSSTETSYYLHVLSVDGEGNSKETIKGPIYVSTDYHKHTGNSSSGGGCYTKANYHSHSSSCYTTTYHWHSGNSSSGGGCYTKPNYSSGSDYRNCPYGYEHTHSGSSTSGGGCYGSSSSTLTCTTAEHTHGSSCYSSLHSCTKTRNQWMCNDCGRYKWYAAGTDYTHKKCNACGSPHYTMGCQRLTAVEWTCNYCGKVTGSDKSGTTGCTSHLTCTKTEHTHGSSCYRTTYSLNCGKTEHTHTSSCVYSWNYVSSYSLNCGYSNGQATGSYLSCSKNSSTIDSYSQNCGKTTSTIDGYVISY